MGWVESPTFFCAAIDTGRNIVNFYYTKCTKILPHPLEHHLLTDIQKQPASIAPTNTASEIEVYVDDCIVAANNIMNTNTTHLAQALLPPPTIT